MRDIKILGTGCSKCEQLTKVTKTVADESGEPYRLEKVTDFMKFADYGVMITPALVVDGKVVAAGKVPSLDELRRYLAVAGLGT
jgi:small redox-active disulfide protein 2